MTALFLPRSRASAFDPAGKGYAPQPIERPLVYSLQHTRRSDPMDSSRAHAADRGRDSSRFDLLPDGFVRLDVCAWPLSSDLEHGRRQRLLQSPPFSSLVDELDQHVRIASMRMERKRCWDGEAPRPFRIVAKLALDSTPSLVDLFHNGASGVRAQCLHCEELGAAALDLARDRLRYRALQLLPSRRTNLLTEEVIRASLADASAKIWIHQGRWVREACTGGGQLHIEAWSGHIDPSKKERDLIRYGACVPDAPAAIDLIGGWMHPTQTVEAKTSALRAHQVASFGFT